MKIDGLPIGFLSALTENKSAMLHFSSLSDKEKRELLSEAEKIERTPEKREGFRRLALSLATDIDLLE